MTDKLQSKLSIIIPVLNETEMVHRQLLHLKQLKNHQLIEVIIVDADPGGATINSITINPKSLPFPLKLMASDPGKGRQMNMGVKHSVSGRLLFLHVDCFLPENAIELVTTSNHPCGAFDILIDGKGFKFWLISIMANFRTHMNLIPYGDQAQFFQADLFQSLGGFKEIPFMEDFEIMQWVKKAGIKPHLFKSKLLVSNRRWLEEGAIYVTLRNWAVALCFSWGVPVEKLTRFYRFG